MRKRTLENYPVPGTRDSGLLVDGVESADDEQKTPKAGGNVDTEDPGSSGRYPSSKWLAPSLLSSANIVICCSSSSIVKA